MGDAKGRLVFVGLGLWDEKDMTVRAREVLQSADHVIAEFYTSRLFGCEKIDLAKAIGRSYEILARQGVEDGESQILSHCLNGQTVAFVTAGDTLTATTHQALRHAAIRHGIPVEIVHGVSIKTAASGLVGLSDYKFGRTTTLVFPEERFFPESPMDVIVENRKRGLHTLVLLDIRSEDAQYMTADQGSQVLIEILDRRIERGEPVESSILNHDTEVIGIARAGSPEPYLHAGPLSSLAQHAFGDPLHCLVVPGGMTDDEQTIASLVTGHTFSGSA